MFVDRPLFWAMSCQSWSSWFVCFKVNLGWCGANFHLSSSGAIFRNSCQNRQRKKIEWKCLDSHENVQYFSKKIDLENVSLCYGQPKIGGCAPLITISGLRDFGGPLVPWEQSFLSGNGFYHPRSRLRGLSVACQWLVWFGRHKLMFNTFSTPAMCKGTALQIFSK